MWNVQSGPNGVCQEAGFDGSEAKCCQFCVDNRGPVITRGSSPVALHAQGPSLWRVKPHLEVLPAMTGCFDVYAASPNEDQHDCICNPQDDASESLGESRPNWTSKLLGLLQPHCGVPILPCLQGRLARSRVSSPPVMMDNCRNTCQMAASCCLANSPTTQGAPLGRNSLPWQLRGT